MNKELLRNSVDVLKHIRAELPDTVEDSVISQLDNVIQELEAAQNSGTEIAVRALDVLLLLGKLIEKLPEIASAIEYLMLLINNTPSQ